MAEGDPGTPSLPGYQFEEPQLLLKALTHSSCGSFNNQRLEFLGDAVVGLAVAQMLFERTPKSQREGPLTQARARVVSREGLAAAARRVSLGAKLILGQGEAQAGGAEKDSILCGAFEAVIGAIFVDGGYDAALHFCREVLDEAVDRSVNATQNKDPKNQLQEAIQARGLGPPRYRTVATGGEVHEPIFEARVEVGCLAATGIGGTKKDAERDAARQALQTLDAHPDLLSPSKDEAS